MPAFRWFLTKRRLAFIAMLSLLAAPAKGAVVAELQNCGPGCTVRQIRITGNIDRQTYDQLLQILQAPRFESTNVYFAPQVRLNSMGGSVEDAMAIGTKLREENFSTVVSQGDTCESACVLILAAGVIRVAVYGIVGIGRPRFEDRAFASLSPVEAGNKYEELAESVRKYLARMGISDLLYVDMVKMSSNDVRVLSDSEMRAYELVGAAPAWANTVGRLNSGN
jgi:hypothetical protein